MNIKEILQVWREVFGNWKYLSLGILTFLAFYSANVILSNYAALSNYYSIGFFKGSKFFAALFLGFKDSLLFHSFVSLVTIGILFGMLVSLISYKTNMLKSISKNIGIIGTLGIFLGVLAPGCAACGIGIISALGFGAAIVSFLPFHGLELSLLSIGLLGFSVFKISKDIKKGIVCKI